MGVTGGGFDRRMPEELRRRCARRPRLPEGAWCNCDGRNERCDSTSGSLLFLRFGRRPSKSGSSSGGLMAGLTCATRNGRRQVEAIIRLIGCPKSTSLTTYSIGFKLHNYIFSVILRHNRFENHRFISSNLMEHTNHQNFLFLSPMFF